MTNHNNQDIFSILGLQDATDEVKQNILQETESAVTDRVLMRSLAFLPEAAYTKLESEETSPEEVLETLRANVPDFDNLVIEETEKYLIDLADLVSSVEK